MLVFPSLVFCLIRSYLQAKRACMLTLLVTQNYSYAVAVK
jgi:hypothetical protein